MPPFDDDGNLPGGIYHISWSEFAERFGTNGHRQRLIVGLIRALILLAQAGCQYVCVGGSFVTSKEYPNDFNVWFEDQPISFGTLDPIFDNRDAMKAEFGGEFFSSPPFQFLQKDKNGNPRGIVALDPRELL